VQARPFESAAIAAFRTRAEWDASAVETLGAVLDRWGLVAGEPFSGGFSGTVLRVTTARGEPAVLKVGYPHEEAIAEAVALQALPADAAPALLRQDAWAWAMLLEEVRPGTTLAALTGGTTPEWQRMSAAAALAAGGELLARLAAVGAVAGVPSLEDVVRGYAAVARDRRADQLPELERLGVVALVDDALDELTALAGTGPSTAFVHGDLNPGNILRCGDGWAAVDPKPAIGDAAFDPWPLAAQIGAPLRTADQTEAAEERLGTVCRAAGLDPVRAGRWCVARCGLTVTWYLAEGDTALAGDAAAELRVWIEARRRLTGGAV